MATTYCGYRNSFWSMSEISPFYGAPFRVNKIMSRYRYDSIVAALQFTNKDPPTTYQDMFWEVWDIVEAWNNNMETNFSPSWISCLDESMSKWLLKYTCPGYMCVPRKPWRDDVYVHVQNVAEIGRTQKTR